MKRVLIRCVQCSKQPVISIILWNIKTSPHFLYVNINTLSPTYLFLQCLIRCHRVQLFTACWKQNSTRFAWRPGFHFLSAAEICPNYVFKMLKCSKFPQNRTVLLPLTPSDMLRGAYYSRGRLLSVFYWQNICKNASIREQIWKEHSIRSWSVNK